MRGADGWRRTSQTLWMVRGLDRVYAMAINGLVKRRHFNSAVISRAKETRELHKRIGHLGDTALGNALDHGAYSGNNLTSSDLAALADYYGECTACLEYRI